MKIVIAGNYGAKNLGDEMILEGILEVLKIVAPEAKITVLSGNPEETKEKYQINSVPKYPAGIRSFIKSLFNKKTDKAVKECDFFILGGGGLFGNLSFKANIIWGIQAQKAYHNNKPVIIYGQSVELPKDIFQKFIVRNIFKKAAMIVVRDDESKKVLKVLGIKNPIYTVHDLAFRKQYEFIKPAERSDEAIVSLRYMKNLSEKFKNEIADFLDYLVGGKNFKVKFIDFQRESDHKIHKDIINRLKSGKDKIEHINCIKNTEELLEHFSKAKLVLGMRLHSLISAVKTETPFIAINYAPKIKGFLEYVGLDEYIEEIGSLRLKEKFKDIEEKYAEHCDKIKFCLKKISSERVDAEEKLKNLFSKACHF